jgi:hypothetical protein
MNKAWIGKVSQPLGTVPEELLFEFCNNTARFA